MAMLPDSVLAAPWDRTTKDNQGSSSGSAKTKKEKKGKGKGKGKR